jgi:Icc protein
MPITLPTTSRRRWLQQATAAGFGTLAAKLPAMDLPEQLWVLFSDPHIAEDEKTIAREVCMAENLTRCVNQVLKIGQKPFGVVVNGDCALTDGKTEDYATFVRLMEPLTSNSIQVHCTLGNHDSRQNFINAVLPPGPPNAERQVPVADKHVAVVSSATMNWVLLDSLHSVNQTPGLLGDLQLGWLDRTLRGLPNKPTLVCAHHNPMLASMDEKKKNSCLQDSDPRRARQGEGLHPRPHPQLEPLEACRNRPARAQPATGGLHLRQRPPERLGARPCHRRKSRV